MSYTAAFCVPTPLLSSQLHGSSPTLTPRGTRARPNLSTSRRSVRSLRMQLPPLNWVDPPLTEEEAGSPDYKWDPSFPGTLKPGMIEENYPLEKVLSSSVFNDMVYQELDADEKTAEIFEPDEDFLQWLSQQGRLMPQDMSDEEFEMEADRQIEGITEEDLDFSDDDSKMIAYYSRQGEGTAAGSSLDFGGFSESASGDFETGF